MFTPKHRQVWLLEEQLANCQQRLWHYRRAQQLIERTQKSLDHEWHEQERLMQETAAEYCRLQNELERAFMD